MKKILWTFCLLLFQQNLSAQNYTFSTYNTPYVPLTGSTSLTNNNLWSAYNSISGVANFGFNFIADGTMTTAAINFNSGMIPTAVFSNQPNPSMGFVYAPLIALVSDRGIATGTAQSNISYKTEGVPGSRIFKLEWNNVGFYEEIIPDATSSDFMNVQLWLYEGSNIIEYHYGPSNISNPLQSFDGDPGYGCGLYPQVNLSTGDIIGSSYVLSGNGTTPTFAYTPLYEVYVTSPPVTGTVYRFSPTSLNTQEVRATTSVEIFPTLVTDHFNIKIKNSDKLKSVAVYDMSGKLLFRKGDTEQVSMSGYPAGIYTVGVQTASGQKSARIIKK